MSQSICVLQNIGQTLAYYDGLLGREIIVQQVLATQLLMLWPNSVNSPPQTLGGTQIVLPSDSITFPNEFGINSALQIMKTN